MSNSIIDLVIRIKNGYMARKERITSPYSMFKEEVIKKLVAIRYLQGYTVTGEIVKTIHIELLYENEESPAVTDIKIYSKPGRRWYVASSDLKSVLGGLGYSILTTPKGVLTHVEAKKERVGGELLFSIW